MQLKLKRTMKTSGMLTKTNVFCLDARVQFTQEEADAIGKYKLGGEVVYVSEAAKNYAANSVNADGSFGGAAKAWASFAMSKMALTVTVNSLIQGQHIECKDMGELMGAEEAIHTACQNLKRYLENAKAFDGREIVFDYTGDKPAMTDGIVTKAI
jgi:hypothetical protein